MLTPPTPQTSPTWRTSETSPVHAPIVLIIRDGWGQNPNPEHRPFNAILLADTPVDDALRATWPHTLIRTSGEDVGLPPGTMGNSEVGHQNIGAGRIVDQELMRITRTIRDDTFFDRPAVVRTFEYLKRTHGALHLLGLVSRGLVHSDLDHLIALLECAKRHGFPGDRVFVHAIMDGRDTGPTMGLGFMRELEQAMSRLRVGAVASVIGRYWAMDRDHRWERIAIAYQCLTGRHVAHPGITDAMIQRLASSAESAIQNYYMMPAGPSETGDEFIMPTTITDAAGAPQPRMAEGDAVVFFNFRGDRPRQLTKAFVLDDAGWAGVQGGGFDRGVRLNEVRFVTMTGYESGVPVSDIVFEKPESMEMILGETLSAAGLTQFRCAETEKFAHVTFFFNDYREAPFAGEHRLLIPSPREVATYDQKPEMSAVGICAGVLNRLHADDCESVIVVNFANADMVGHTGKLDAVVRAVEVVDACVGEIVAATLARGGALVVTADHGNAEQMWNPAYNCPHTSHTTYDVPLLVIGETHRGGALREGGRLADIAPTILDLLGLVPPAPMTGRSLLM
jgi:2,3-bisphosphoglycerate-independent phosphoglycerate mutase